MLEGSSALRTGIGIQEPGTGTGEPLEGSSALRRGIGIREPGTGTGEPLGGSSALRTATGTIEPLVWNWRAVGRFFSTPERDWNRRALGMELERRWKVLQHSGQRLELESRCNGTGEPLEGSSALRTQTGTGETLQWNWSAVGRFFSTPDRVWSWRAVAMELESR